LLGELGRTRKACVRLNFGANFSAAQARSRSAHREGLVHGLQGNRAGAMSTRLARGAISSNSNLARHKAEPITRGIARAMAHEQRNISVADFFLKNRHLLGFDSPQRALLTAIKEAVDNALDACEEAGILPEIRVEVSVAYDDTLRIAVEDNGPGIVEEQIAKIFGKLLYGSKFHKLAQSRGQQGIGISAAGMYAALTTGKPTRILSRTGTRATAWEFVLSIDTSKNRPDLHRKRAIRWQVPHGTRVEMELVAQHRSGPHSVETYLLATAIANPHVTIHYRGPDGNEVVHRRVVHHNPPRPERIQPHPHGVELGRLIAMLRDTPTKRLSTFLRNEFSRVGVKTAAAIIARTGGELGARSNPRRIAHKKAQILYRAIQRTPVSAPTAGSTVPIGETFIVEGLKKEVPAELYLSHTRPPAVYRGNPFQVEVGLAYGRPEGAKLSVAPDGSIREAPRRPLPRDSLLAPPGEVARLLRYANRVPLLFQQAECAITQAVTNVNWHRYGIAQQRGALPTAPLVILVHVASVWVPFTSESKQAIARYTEIDCEIDLALRYCARELGAYVHRASRLAEEFDHRRDIERYLPHIGLALEELLDLNDEERDRLVAKLDQIMQRRRKH
jgi:DNA topoisomerase-6 subunit B